MHTDEYEISLSRELVVCDGYIRKYQKLLREMEERHSITTENFLAGSRTIGLHESSELTVWQQTFESLQRWSVRRNEYNRLLGTMKGTFPR